MPRPGTRVIPAKWDTHHRPLAENTMLAVTVELRRPSSDAVFDETAGKSVYPAPTVLWGGGARVQRISRRGSEKPIGGRYVTEQTYQVSVPVDIPEAFISDQIKFITSESDPALPGKIVRITEVRLGSNLWERDLLCEEVTPTTR